MPEQHGRKYGDHFTDIGTQQEPYHLPNVGVDAPALPDSIHNGGKIIIRQGHVCRALGYILSLIHI